MGFIAVRHVVATIPINTALSDAVDLRGGDLIRINMPALWTAAGISFLVDDGDGTFRDLWMEWGWELWFDAAADISIELSVFARFQALTQFKVRSGTSGAPVNQTAEREILLAVGVKS